MQFPVYLWLGGWRLHPHLVFESLAYAIALRLTLLNVRRDTIAPSQRTSIMVGGMVGALVGAKLLVMLQHLDLAWSNPLQYGLLLIQGKTVVGALLGAVAGVELTKNWIGVTRSTGDAFVTPLLAGMMIGRIGCFLTGLSDRTYGTPTTLPWGVDFGDGIPRHPTQLYEILFLALVWLMLRWRVSIQPQDNPLAEGDQFKFYMIAYLSFRLVIDVIKPDFHPFLGLSAIQIACLVGLIYYRQAIPRLFGPSISHPSP